MYKNELKNLEVAITEIVEKVPSLRVNAVQLKAKAGELKKTMSNAVTAAWKIEDSLKNNLFVTVSGGDTQEAPDLIFTVEVDLGQFLEVSTEQAKLFLELNYTKFCLGRVGLTEDQRLIVLHRRYLEGLSIKDAFDSIAEVWNTAENLRTTMNRMRPGTA